MPAGSLSEAFALEAARRLLDAGLQRVITVLTPGVGAEWSQTVPGGATWELLAVRFSLSTSAVVANRFASVAIRDNDGVQILRFPPPAAIAASGAPITTFATGYGVTVNQGHMAAPLPSPPIILSQGWSIASLTSALDVGDQYSGIVLTVRELSPAELVQRIDQIQIDLDAVTNL